MINYEKKKITTEYGKIRYGYLLQNKNSIKIINAIRCSPTYLVILDKIYNEINKNI